MMRMMICWICRVWEGKLGKKVDKAFGGMEVGML